MGYKRVPLTKKLQSVSYVIAGMNQTDAAQRAGTSSKSVQKWCNDPAIRKQAQELYDKALIQTKIEKGLLIQRGKRLYTKEGYDKLVAHGKARATDPKFLEGRSTYNELRKEESKRG